MRGHVFVVHGDITKCVADAIAYSTSTRARGEGKLYASFAALEGFDEQYAALRERAWNPGDTFWIPRAPTRPPIVVTFAAGRGERTDPVTRSHLLVRNTIVAAVTELRREQPTKRLLVLLPGFLIGVGGARAKRREMARAQITAAAATLAEIPNVDVAFVLFQPADHDVFRDARRACSPELLADVAIPEGLVRAARDREVVVFVGSGMSIGSGMPSWSALVARLRLGGATAGGIDEYLAIAQAYRDGAAAHGKPPLATVIAELFGRRVERVPTLAHYLLASLEASNVITTNYDHLIEDTLAAQRTAHLAVIDTAHVPETGNRGRVNVVKFHGDAAHGDEIVLGKDDYDQFFAKRPAFALLLSGLLLNQTFLFVGYSLSDPNFQQIYQQIIGMLGASARRPVVTTFVAQDQPLPHLDVVRFEGVDQPAQLARWLDRLVDDAVRPRSVLLAETHDAEPSPALVDIRAKLLELASLIERTARDPLQPEEARVLVQLLVVLFDHGFQSRLNNTSLLARLAMSFSDPAERSALLREAASHADSRDGAALVEALLAP